MRRDQYKISYVRQPLAKRSIPGAACAAAALLFGVVSLTLSVLRQGQGGLNVAAWGASSLLFSLASAVFDLMALGEQEVNLILAKAALILSGLLIVFWLCLILVGLLV